MAGKRNNNRNKKHCPFIDAECLQDDCMLYHEDFDRCYVDLLAINLYNATVEMKKLNKKRD